MEFEYVTTVCTNTSFSLQYYTHQQHSTACLYVGPLLHNIYGPSAITYTAPCYYINNVSPECYLIYAAEKTGSNIRIGYRYDEKKYWVIVTGNTVTKYTTKYGLQNHRIARVWIGNTTLTKGHFAVYDSQSFHIFCDFDDSLRDKF